MSPKTSSYCCGFFVLIFVRIAIATTIIKINFVTDEMIDAICKYAVLESLVIATPAGIINAIKLYNMANIPTIDSHAASNFS